MAEKTGYPSKDKTHLAGIPKEKLYPDIKPYSMFAIFSQINQGRMEEVALEEGEATWTKNMIYIQTITFADALFNSGVRPGDRIAIALPNCAEGIIATLGANAIGVEVMYLNPATVNIESVEEIVKNNDIKILFSDKDFFYDIMSRGSKDPSLKTLALIKEHSISDKIAIYLQTSGSTSGVPKILPFTNRAVFAALMYIANSTGTKTNDESVNSVLCIIPYRLPYGWMTIFINLIAGNKVILAPGASPKDIGEYYKLKPSYVYGTPVIFRTFMEETPKDADLSSITAFFCSGFAIPEEWYQEGSEYFAKHGNFKAEIRNNYGIGEGLCIGTASDGVEHKPETCGKFYIGPEWLLVDDDGNEVKYGEIGEAIVAAESLCCGYYEDESATELAFEEIGGKIFYHTGDYMRLAEDGYVTFVGRKKRFYQPKGATDKVNCETIEGALVKSSIVGRCAVVIGKDDDGYEAGFAFVQPKDCNDDFDAINAELWKTIDAELLDFQKPKKIFLLPEIPMMKSGKPDYTGLRNILDTLS